MIKRGMLSEVEVASLQLGINMLDCNYRISEGRCLQVRTELITTLNIFYSKVME